MAEATGLRNNALNYPVYASPFGVVFAILDADGDPVTGAASLDSEVSLNGDTFADCTNEATEIATSSGFYYLLLTAAEMTSDVVTVQVKTATSGAKTTPIVLYPRKLVTLRSGTSAGGASGSITLDSGASAVDDFYNGCLVVGTLDSAVEARIITDYTGSTKVAAVTPNWNTTPDSDDTFIVYLPEGIQVNQANVTLFGGSAGTFASGIPAVNTTQIEGSDATNQIRDSVVDDATRIDASALNTLSGHDPGETIMGATDLGTGAGLTSLATAAALATVDGIVDDILVDTAEIGTAGAGLTNIDLPNQTMNITGNITGNLSGSVGSVSGAVGSVTGAVGSVTGSVGSVASGGIASTSFASGAITAAALASDAVNEIVDQVWEEAIADHEGTAGSTAEALADAGGSGASAADIADAVWDEATSGHTTSGTFGEQLKTDVDAILVDTAEIGVAGAGLTAADDAVITAIGALNNLSQANVRTAVGLGSANLDTQLGDLPTNAELATALGTADDAVLTAIDALPTNAELATALAAADDAVLAAIAALNNLSAAQVNAQVVDALAVDTYGESSAVPAATATLAAKIQWLATLARNTIQQTATTQTLKNDAGSGNIATAAVSDDATTFERSEWQ